MALRHWHKLRPELPELQFVLWDEESDAVVAHGRTLPARAAEGLPGGIDDMLETWFGDDARPEPDVLSGMVRSSTGEAGTGAFGTSSSARWWTSRGGRLPGAESGSARVFCSTAKPRRAREVVARTEVGDWER